MMIPPKNQDDQLSELDEMKADLEAAYDRDETHWQAMKKWTQPKETQNMTDKQIVPTQPIIAALQTLDFGDVERIFGAKLDIILRHEANLLAQARRVEVTNRDQFRNAGDLYKMIDGPTKDGEELRTSWTGPINQGLKRIKKVVDDRLAPSRQALVYIKVRMDKWGREEERRIAAEQERLRKEAEDKALAEAKKKEDDAAAARKLEQDAATAGEDNTALAAAEIALKAEHERDEILEAPAKMPTVDPTVRRVRGFHGATSGMKKTWGAKIVGIRDLNDECVAAIMANDKAVNAIRIALEAYIQPRLARLRTEGQCEPLPGVAFDQDSSANIR